MAPFDPGDPAFLADPYPTFAELRAQGPVHDHPLLGFPVAVSHAACSEVLRSRDLGRIWVDAEPAGQFPAFNLLHRNSLLEREGPPHGLDEIVLERYAAAAEVTLERAAALVRAGQDPALVELVLSAETGETERARALRLLGFDPAAPLCALAVAPPAQGDGRSRPPEAGPAAGLRAMGHHVRTAAIGDIQAVLVTPTVPQVTTPAVAPAQGTGPDVLGPRLERLAAAGDGARVGVGPELPGARAAESWAGARTALRFTGPHDRVIRWSELGALALFADLPEQAIAELDDVRAMSRLSDESLQAIRALCQAGSIRGAAAALHLHHSSLAARVARAESVLGFSPAEPSGRLRAHLALALLRLLANTGAGHHRPGASPV